MEQWLCRHKRLSGNMIPLLPTNPSFKSPLKSPGKGTKVPGNPGRPLSVVGKPTLHAL